MLRVIVPGRGVLSLGGGINTSQTVDIQRLIVKPGGTNDLRYLKNEPSQTQNTLHRPPRLLPPASHAELS